MFAIFAAIFVLVGALVGGILLSKAKGNQQKLEADEFKSGTTTEGTEIPIVFGTVHITNPIHTWIGDKRVDPIKKTGGKK